MYRKLTTRAVGLAVTMSVLTACGGGGDSVSDQSSATSMAGDVGENSTDTGIDLAAATDGESGADNQIANGQSTSGDEPVSEATSAQPVDTDSVNNSGVGTEQIASGEPADAAAPPTEPAAAALKQVPNGLDIGDPVSTPSGVDPFSKFQLDDALYTNNVYDGRQLDADNNWQLIFYNGVQDYVEWEVPALIGNNADPCVRPQWDEPLALNYRLTSRKDSPNERDTFVRAFPAMVVGTMGGRYESWGVECGRTLPILPSAQRHGGSPVFQMETVADATGLPVLAGELDYDIRVSARADLEDNAASPGIANIFMDSYWHNVSDAALLPGANTSLVNTINGISSDFTEVWNLNIWFDYPRFRGTASQWTGGRKIGSVNLQEGGLFDIYFKIEGRRDGHVPICRLGTNENCFLYIGLVTTDNDAARNGITVNYTEIADWMRSADFRDLFLNGAFETETPAARAYEAWRLIDGTDNDSNPDPAKRGPRFPDKNHVIGGIHLGSELWYNPDALPASIVFESLGVSVEGKGDFGRYIEY